MYTHYQHATEIKKACCNGSKIAFQQFIIPAQQASCTRSGNRTRTAITGHRIFVPTTTFVAPDKISEFVVWTFSSSYLRLLSRKIRRLPSSLYTFSDCETGTWLGIASPKLDKGSPNLRGSTFQISLKAPKFLLFFVSIFKEQHDLSPACLPIPPPGQGGIYLCR